jgi:hypothetical protein
VCGVWRLFVLLLLLLFTRFYFVDVSVRYDEAPKVEPVLESRIIKDINDGAKAKEDEKRKVKGDNNDDNDDDNADDDNDKVVVGDPEERKRLETLRAKRCAKCGFRPTHKLKRL